MEMSTALDHFASCSSTRPVCGFSCSSFGSRNGPNRLRVSNSSSIPSTSANSSAREGARVQVFEEGALERPRWTGDDPLSRFVSSLIAIKPLFNVMKIGARQVLIRSVSNFSFLHISGRFCVVKNEIPERFLLYIFATNSCVVQGPGRRGLVGCFECVKCRLTREM